MEGDEQRRRQYDRSNYQRSYSQVYGTHGAHASGGQHLRPVQTEEDLDRYGQGQMLTTRAVTSTPLAAGAGISHDIGSFNFSQGQSYQTIQASQIQTPSFQYQSDYVQESQRQRFSQYPPQMAYTVPPHSQTQPSYDPAQQFQPRQTAAMDVLSSQFGTHPQYFGTEGASSTSQPPPAVIPQDYQAIPYQQTIHYDTQGTLGRSTLASSYPTMASDFSQASGSEVAPGGDMEVDIAAQNNGRFYRAIGETNPSTQRGMLVQAGHSLIQISDWLLTNAIRLGLLSIMEHPFRFY